MEEYFGNIFIYIAIGLVIIALMVGFIIQKYNEDYNHEIDNKFKGVLVMGSAGAGREIKPGYVIMKIINKEYKYKNTKLGLIHLFGKRKGKFIFNNPNKRVVFYPHLE